MTSRIGLVSSPRYLLFTDLLFSQMIVERGNENKNRGRFNDRERKGEVGGLVNEKIFFLYFFPRCALALALRARSADLRRKNKMSVDRLRGFVQKKKKKKKKKKRSTGKVSERMRKELEDVKYVHFVPSFFSSHWNWLYHAELTKILRTFSGSNSRKKKRRTLSLSSKTDVLIYKKECTVHS